MTVADWLALEQLKNRVNELFPHLELELKPPTEDHSSTFTLEGYRINITEWKPSYQMGELDKQIFLSYNLAHEKFVNLYEHVINRGTRLSDVTKTWKCPSLYFITVYKTFENIEANDDKIIEFLGEEIRSERLYNISSNKERNIITVEKLLYIGRTTDIIGRYRDGHKVTQALSNPQYDGTEKRIYIAEIDIFNIFKFKETIGIENFQDKFLEFTPIESINNRELVEDIQIFIERYFISYYQVPFYNVKDKTPKVNFVKWPMVSQPNIITIRDFEDSCFFDGLTLQHTISIDELLEEPRNKYEKSKKQLEEKKRKFKKSK